MKPRRLGCLTGAGLLAAALTLAVVLGVFLVRGGRMFSPGPLHAEASGSELGGVTSHADSGGDCTICHTAPWDPTPMAQRCQDCHSDIAADLADPATLHGALKAQGADMDCRQCHTEHRGASADLTFMAMDDFPHEVVGFSLAGHAIQRDGSPFDCQDCHSESLARFDVLTCDDCHRQDDAAFMQAHAADFGTDCLACHDGIDSYARDTFDHSRLAFPLTGRHVEASCGDCHANARSAADLQAAPTDCAACHAQDDAHDGQFGADCAACHVTSDWQDATFDHSLTAFPLTGQHEAAECVQCHVDSVFQGTPTDCVACHAQDDAHDGQFGADCAACHVTSDWQDATFDHSLTAFPLTGQHEATQCVQCHVDRVFQGTPTDCVACHAEPDFHATAFAVTCADCHTTSAWQPARFDGPHTFPVDHGESGVSSCQTCHTTQVQQYTCYSCHDPAETAEEHLDEGISDFQDCTSCHPTGTKDEAEGRREDD